jgi:hypothetical protein
MYAIGKGGSIWHCGVADIRRLRASRRAKSDRAS